jgi:hypothetical protein
MEKLTTGTSNLWFFEYLVVERYVFPLAKEVLELLCLLIGDIWAVSGRDDSRTGQSGG